MASFKIAKQPPGPVPLVLISDPGQDLDDEMSFIMLRYLVKKGLVELRGIICTLAPAFDRARLCRGTLDLLGLHDCPVGIGTDGGDQEGLHTAKCFAESASSYMPAAASESCSTLTPGRGLLYRLYCEAEPKSLTLAIIASLKDAALFLRDHEALFVEKTKEVVIMGGVEPVESSGPDEVTLLSPDSANNNTFDPVASAFFYRRCQEIGVPLVIVSRWAAYAAKMPRDVYDDLALSGSSIGWRLRNAQRDSIEALWRRSCAPADDVDTRMRLPPRCDRGWFIDTFCAGRDDPARGGGDAVWDLVDGFMQYDSMAVLAAIPELRETYFDPTIFKGPMQQPTQVIGRTQEQHGVAEPVRLVQLMQDGFTQGLGLNHSPKAHVIVLIQLRWDNMPDVRLTCVMLRALWGLGIMDCVGIMVSLDPHAQPDHGHPATNPATPRPPVSGKASGPSAAAPASEGGGASEEGARWRRKLSRTAASASSIVTSASLAPRWNTSPQWDPTSPEGSRRGRRTSLGSEGGKSGHRASPSGSSQAQRGSGRLQLGEGERERPHLQGERPRARRHTFESTERYLPPGGSGGGSFREEEEEEEEEEDEEEEEELLEQADEISATLHALGLAHVPVHVVSRQAARGGGAAEHLRKLYHDAPPVGVTLIVTSTLTEVAAFATEEGPLFRQKTVRVIHMGAASVLHEAATGRAELAPEPSAQNNRLDLQAALSFYRRAQELSVPLVVISRHLSHACRVPAELFDILASHGGQLGTTVRDEQRESFNMLWERANAPVGDTSKRRKLPERCDRAWFVRSFCSGEHPPEAGAEDVWPAIESVRLYNPMALLASLPPFVDQFLECTPVRVRSAKHMVVGLSADSGCVHDYNLGRLRSLLYQCLYNGTTSNASEYELGCPPPLPVSFKGEALTMMRRPSIDATDEPPSHRAVVCPRGRKPSWEPPSDSRKTRWSQGQSPMLGPETPQTPQHGSLMAAAALEAQAQGPHIVHRRPSDSYAQASAAQTSLASRRSRSDSPLLQEGDASASCETPPAVPSASRWGKVRNLHIQRAPTLDRAGLTWHCDPGESALKELLLGSRSLGSYTIAGEHVPL